MKPSILFLFATAALIGQNAPIAENDQVRVLKVTDVPHRKSALHEHPVNRVMIYLTSGHLRVTYEDGHVDDQHLKAGQVRWSKAGGKHTSENVEDKPLEIVEVELKKPGSATPAATGPLDPVKVDPRHYKVELENNQVRVLRVTQDPHGKVPLHEHYGPRVVVYLTDLAVKVTPEGGSPTESHFTAGDVRLSGPARHMEENLTDKRAELIVVELKK